jgi:uncharacterized membrane protein HdeD (DUF308 family)
MIDNSGLGLLPGIGLALALAVLATGGLLLENWLLTVGVLVFVLGTAACIAGLVWVISDDED